VTDTESHLEAICTPEIKNDTYYQIPKSKKKKIPPYKNLLIGHQGFAKAGQARFLVSKALEPTLR